MARRTIDDFGVARCSNTRHRDISGAGHSGYVEIGCPNQAKYVWVYRRVKGHSRHMRAICEACKRQGDAGHEALVERMFKETGYRPELLPI